MDVKPLVHEKETSHVDEDDTRTFKVRQKKTTFFGKGLGSLYDPGTITIKKKVKIEDSSQQVKEENIASTPLATETANQNNTESDRKDLGGNEKEVEVDKKGGGWRILDEKVNPTVVLPRSDHDRNTKPPTETALPPQAEPIEQVVKSEEETKPSVLVPDAAPEIEAELGTGSLFKPRKIKRPPGSGSSKRSGRF